MPPPDVVLSAMASRHCKRAFLDRANRQGFIIQAAEHDDRGIPRSLSHLLERLQSFALGKRQVQQNHIRLEHRCCSDRFEAIMGGENLVAHHAQ